MGLFGPKQQIGSTQDALKFADIRDGVVILKDGNLRKIILCSAVNFDLKSEQEQNAIIAQYQNFLNSLDFPIQILMQSKKLDLSSYLTKLEDKATKQKNELLRMQMTDYIGFIKRLIDVANIMEKRFYVVVPYLVPPKIGPGAGVVKIPGQNPKQAPSLMTPDEFNKYKEELDRRTQIIESGLGSISIRTAPLTTQQTIELLYNVYNPEEANKEKLIDTDELQGEVIQSAAMKPKEEAKENKENGESATTK